MMERDSRGFIPFCGGGGLRVGGFGGGGRSSISQRPVPTPRHGKNNRTSSSGYFAYFRNCKGLGVKNYEPQAAD